MGLMRLTPEAFVQVDDVVIGGRKLAIVDATGMGYFDLHGEGQLPRPLSEQLSPQELGTIASWLMALPDNASSLLLDAWKRMADENCDQLTIARALRWGIEHDVADYDILKRMGVSLTDQIKAGHRILAEAVSR